MVKERQESELANNASYGLLRSVTPSMALATRAGAPTPGDLIYEGMERARLIFLAHPRLKVPTSPL